MTTKQQLTKKLSDIQQLIGHIKEVYLNPAELAKITKIYAKSELDVEADFKAILVTRNGYQMVLEKYMDLQRSLTRAIQHLVNEGGIKEEEAEEPAPKEVKKKEIKITSKSKNI